jgi:hypothetical protein
MLEGNVNVTLIPPDLRGDQLTQYLTANQAAQSGATVEAGAPTPTPPPVPGG